MAYDYVLWRPERRRSLVIAASGGVIVDEELRQLREKTPPNFSSWPVEFREVSMGYMATNPQGLQRWLEIHRHSQQKGVPAQPQTHYDYV